MARRGGVRPGVARLGQVRQGKVRFTVMEGQTSMTVSDPMTSTRREGTGVRQGMVRHGKVWHG